MEAVAYNKLMESQRSYKNLIWQDEDRMSGAICFYGTRIPVAFLFEYLENSSTIEEFSADYRVEVDMARQVVHLAGQGLESYLDSAA